MDTQDADDERLIASAVRGAVRLEGASAAARARVLGATHAAWREAMAAHDHASAGDAPAAVAVASAGANAGATVSGLPTRAAARRRLPLALAASIVVALLAAGLFWQSRSAGGEPLAVAEATRGSVGVELPGAFGARVATLATRGAVEAGGTVATGERGAALLRLGDGLTVRLAPGSRLTLDSPGHATLEAGLAYVDADPRQGRTPLEIATAHGRVAHVGTQYAVQVVSGGIEVAVREGRVQVSGGALGGVLGAQRGELLRVEASGAAARTPLPEDDARWAWLAEIPVPFELQGATLGRFLDWYARETGNEVAFADPARAAEAAAIRLSGSIAGLPPEEALRVVVASAGLASTREGVRVRIDLP